MWLKYILRGIVFPPTLGGTVWERRVLIHGLTVLRSYRLYSPVYPLQFGARDQDCVPAEHAGRWMTSGQ